MELLQIRVIEEVDLLHNLHLAKMNCCTFDDKITVLVKLLEIKTVAKYEHDDIISVTTSLLQNIDTGK